MSLDYMAIVSLGVYPTTPTSKRRAELAVSFGLLNFAFPTVVASDVISKILQIGKTGVRLATGFFHIGG